MHHIFNLGMGVDSAYCLAKWLTDPTSRNFHLSQLIVLIAQTGDEFDSTKHLIETYLFPLLRQHNVRTIQVARGGPFVRHGWHTLSDTRQPRILHTEGAFKLSQYLIQNGTTIRMSRPHTCAMKFKGYPLDKVIDSLEQESLAGQSAFHFKLSRFLSTRMRRFVLLPNRPVVKLDWLKRSVALACLPVVPLFAKLSYVFGPYICYSAEEEKRKRTADEYGCRGESYIYPNIEQGVTRQDALDFLKSLFGVDWEKSCCKFCPFQSKESATSRYLREPEGLAFAMHLEAIAIHFNPRMYQFSFGTAWQLAYSTRNKAAIDLFWERWHSPDTPWALYHIRRITWLKEVKGKPGTWREDSDRCISIEAIGDRATMLARVRLEPGGRLLTQSHVEFSGSSLSRYAKKLDDFATIPIERRFLVERGDGHPKIEEFLMACPAVVKEKVRNRKRFEEDWQTHAILGGEPLVQSIPLFDLAIEEEGFNPQLDSCIM